MASNFHSKPVEVSRKPKKAALGFIFSVVLLDIIGLTILAPVSAYIVRQYSTDALTVSMLSVIYAAAQFLAAPVLGKLSDRYGRRPVLLISVLGSSFGYVLFGIGGALWVLFLSRLIDGITGGNISTANAYVADITPPEKRSQNFALVGVAFGLGFILGPALGGALSQISLAAPAFAAGAMSLASAVVGFFVLPESLPKETRTQGSFRWAELNPFASIADLVRRPVLRTLLVAQSIFYFVINGNNTILSVFVIDKFDGLPGHIATLFLTGGLLNLIVQGGLVGRLAPRFGEKNLAVSSLVIQAAGSLALVMAPVLWMLYPSIAVSSAGMALIWPTTAALMANSVSPEEQVKVSGVSTSLSGLMSVFGPLWAGSMYDNVAPGSSYWMGAILFLIAGLLLTRLKAPQRQEQAVEGAPAD